MALYHSALLSNTSLFKTKIVPSLSTIKCKASSILTSSDQNNTSRRSVNFFQPPTWHYDYVQSLTSDFVEKSYVEESDRLREEVRVMLSKWTNPVDQLELIDILQRLGLGHHFGLEIRKITENIYKNKDTLHKNNNLHVVALEFRLLRQYGYDVSSDVFNGFLNNKDNFQSDLSIDIKGLLSLYEASFHSMEGEVIFDKAREFSSTYLKEFVHKSNEDNDISLFANHALELPLHWRLPRLEARWFIDVYERRKNMNPALLKLAKLDFNIAQANLQEELKQTSRWWKRIGLSEKLSFARDRLVESFFWATGLSSEPQDGYYRQVMAVVIALITTIDDIYDVYGKLEELELFTDVVDRWDVNDVDVLPDYIKVCFLGLYNFVNEVGFDFLKENGHNIIPHLRKVWAGLCKAYLVEAKWYHNGYKPSLHEYLENAQISISVPLLSMYGYFLLPNSMKKEKLGCMEEYSDIVRSSGFIFRLSDDLGTYKREKETGDVPKAIECYMNEAGVSEEEACIHIKSLMSETWKKMNGEATNPSCSKNVIQTVVNVVRVSLCMYQHGDGHSINNHEIKNHIMSLFFQPIIV